MVHTKFKTANRQSCVGYMHLYLIQAKVTIAQIQTLQYVIFKIYDTGTHMYILYQLIVNYIN